MHPSSRLMRYGVCRQLLTPRAWPCHHSSSTLSPTSCLATVELTGAWRFPHRTFCSRTQPNLANPPSPPYTHANALGANADGASFPFSFNGAPHRNTADADDAQGHTTAESIFAATFPNSHAYTHMYAASSAEGDAHHQERSTNASDTRQMGGAWAGLRSAAAMAAAGAAASAREPGKTGAQQQHEMDAQEEQAQLNRLSPQQREELAAYRKTHAEWVDKNKQLIDDRHEAFQIKQAAEELRKSGSHTASQEVSQSMRFFLFGVIPFMILVGLVRYADTIFFMEDLKSINVVDYNKAIKEEEREKKR